MTEFMIESWSAWAPGLPTRSDWMGWAGEDELSPGLLEGDEVPDLDWVEPRQRRRLSRLTEMLLFVAFDACERANQDVSSVPSVFASRHGEVETTIELLESIGERGLLSPMGFSNSVHNTASGYFGILAENKSASHSVASGIETFPQGFLDALALAESSDGPVLFVFGDLILPEPFTTWEADPAVQYATAFVVNREGEGIKGELEVDQPGEGPTTERPGLHFLHDVLQGNVHPDITTDRHVWDFELEAPLV